VWGTGGVTPPFLTLALFRGEKYASRPSHFNPWERVLGTYWIGGSRSGCCGEENNLLPCRNSISSRPVHSPSRCRLRCPGSSYNLWGVKIIARFCHWCCIIYRKSITDAFIHSFARCVYHSLLQRCLFSLCFPVL
jgi:hypothetical protein